MGEDYGPRDRSSAMGYHVIDPDDLDPLPDRPSSARSITDAAGLDNVGIRRYDAEPGEQLPLAYHVHGEQEEVFYVLEGTLHVETPEREFVVGRGEAFVADPGSPHRAHNPAGADAPVSVLAVGAPAVDDAEPYDP